MRKWNLIFDADLCTGCHNCTVAVQDEYLGNRFAGYSEPMPRDAKPWVELRRRDRGAYPIVDVGYQFKACQHCDNAPCIEAARDGAVYKRPDGIVVIDPSKARGQRQIVEACPYSAIAWNDELQLPQHWNFDAHLLDGGWAQPRAAQACPTGALRALCIEDAAMQDLARSDGLRTLAPEGEQAGAADLKPRIYYKNSHRFDSHLIGGTVAEVRNGMEECASGLAVSLTCDGSVQETAQTNAFGEFLFDGLPTVHKTYTVEIRRQGSLVTRKEINLTGSTILEVIKI